MVLTFSTRKLPLVSKGTLLFGTLCTAIALVQLWFVFNPTDTVWYTPAVLFYLKFGSGCMGLGSFLVLRAQQKRFFLPHHHLGITLILAACLGYAIIGFGTEYVAFLGKPQAYIERAELLFWMSGAILGVVKIACPYSKPLHHLIRLACAFGIVGLLYTVLAPIHWAHLPAFSQNLNLTIWAITAIFWITAGTFYLRLDKDNTLFLDPVIGYSLILAGVISGMHAFTPWHPLWTIWQYTTALSFAGSTLALTYIQSQRRRFQIKPFFFVAFTTLLIPFITLASGLAGFGAWYFGANALSLNSAAKTQAYQAELMQPSDQRHAYVNLDIMTYANVEQLLLSLEQLPAAISPTLVESASFEHPVSTVSRTLTPGQPPRYHLVHIVPLNTHTHLAGPVAVVSESLPQMHASVARVRLIALGFVILAATGIFYGLWRIIQRADHRIVAQQSSLQETVADLKEAEQSREDLTNMIVHDLRSPLSAIHTSLQLLERTVGVNLSAHQTRPLTRALDASTSMSRMISDMLNVSKLERGQLELNRSEVHVQDMLADRALTFEPLAQKDGKQIRQICDITSQQAAIFADGDLLRRVLDNLITNAIRYTPRGGTITLSAKALPDQMQFQVIDTGVGISAEYLASVFKKFTQVSTDDIQRRKGVGLGLAFCKLAVEAHGGLISVESQLDEGTTFTFTIPYQPSEEVTLTIVREDIQDQKLSPIRFDEFIKAPSVPKRLQ